MKKKKKMSLHVKRALTGYMFILPWFLGFLLLYVRSIWMTGKFSLSELTMGVTSYDLKFVGLENFRYAFFAHGSFKQTLVSSITNMLVDVPLIIFFSLFMAIILNKKFKGRGIVRAIFFLPVILGADAIVDALALSEKMMNGGIAAQAAEVASASSGLSFDMDYIVDMLVEFGLPVKILSYVSDAVSRINDIISASGVQLIIFIAALQSISGSMYEVAKIEGATGYETFWKVTFPMVMPHIITNVVFTIVERFADSDVIELAYKTCFTEFNYGLSSVFSLVSTLITCLLLILIVAAIQKRTFYYT